MTAQSIATTAIAITLSQDSKDLEATINMFNPDPLPCKFTVLGFVCWTEKPTFRLLDRQAAVGMQLLDTLIPFVLQTFGFRIALIRTCYNKRVDHSAYSRLTFALLGVATPSNLVHDKRCTPFNIGRAIALTGFEFHEAMPLVNGLQKHAEDPYAVLQSVLEWTGGQPFLTQKLCKLVQTSPYVIPQGSQSQWMQQLVQSRIIQNWESQDEPPHLKTIRDRLLRNEQRANRLLGCYENMLAFEELWADESLEQMELRLSGLVVEHHSKLKVYNPIYAAIFDLDWVEQTLISLRPYANALSAWTNSNRQDNDQLLRGEDLLNAQAWMSDKSLGDQDYHFLAASLTFDKQIALDGEEEAANLIAEAHLKAKQIIYVGWFIFAIALTLTGVVGILASQTYRQTIFAQ